MAVLALVFGATAFRARSDTASAEHLTTAAEGGRATLNLNTAGVILAAAVVHARREPVLR